MGKWLVLILVKSHIYLYIDIYSVSIYIDIYSISIGRYRLCLIVGWKAEQVTLPINFQSMIAIQVNKGTWAASSQGVILQVFLSTQCQHFIFLRNKCFVVRATLKRPQKYKRWQLTRHKGIAPLLEAVFFSIIDVWLGFCNEINPSYSWIERCFVLSSWTPCRLRTQHWDGRPPAETNSSRGPLADTHPAVVVRYPCMRQDLVQGNTPTGSRRPGMRMVSFYNPSQPT